MNIAADCKLTYSFRTSARALALFRQRRERILAALAFVSLLVAWDATLRLDERVSPARVRMAHAVDVESEVQTAALAQ